MDLHARAVVLPFESHEAYLLHSSGNALAKLGQHHLDGMIYHHAQIRERASPGAHSYQTHIIGEVEGSFHIVCISGKGLGKGISHSSHTHANPHILYGQAGNILGLQRGGLAE